jgi:sec-independent protein translocase protein TatA
LFNTFGLPELLVVLVVILLIFGVGRISKVAGELGNAIRQFREGLQGKSDDQRNSEDDNTKKNS